MSTMYIGDCSNHKRCSWILVTDLPRYDWDASKPYLSRNDESYWFHDGVFNCVRDVIIACKSEEGKQITRLINEGDNFALRKYLDTIVMSHLTIEQVLQALTEVYYAAVQMGREEEAQTIRQALMIE